MKISKKEFYYIKNRLNEEKNSYTVKVVSDSMEPAIKKDDFLEVETIDLGDLKPFDIVVFWQNNVLVCHCYWSKSGSRPEYIVTKSLKYRKHFDMEIEGDLLLGIVANKRISFIDKCKFILSRNT